jgi:hypothetical protein
MVIFVWSDWNGVRVETYDRREEAAEHIAPILALQEMEENGTTIHTVIEGKELTIKPVQVTSKVILQI